MFEEVMGDQPEAKTLRDIDLILKKIDYVSD